LNKYKVVFIENLLEKDSKLLIIEKEINNDNNLKSEEREILEKEIY
jgi:hypothetical protein